MKLSPQSCSLLVAGISCLTTSVFAAEAMTDPVGFITLAITGTGGGAAKYSFKGLGLTRSVDYQGSAETSAGGTSTLVDNDATWTDNLFNGAAAAVTHYVEITSGPSAGTTYDITATTASTKTLTLAQPLAAGVANDSTFKVRKHWTIGDVFGPNNEGGLFGGNSGSADQVLVYGPGGVPVTYYYKASGPGGTGWRSTNSTSAPEVGRVIYPEEAIVIKRTQSADVSLVLTGAVKVGQSSYPVVVGNNFLANVCATNMTLADSGLYTADNTLTGLKGGTSGTADQVLLWNGTGYDTFYYKTSGPGGTGWRSTNSTSAPEDTHAISVASAVIIVRKFNGAFNWVIPQHPTTL